MNVQYLKAFVLAAQLGSISAAAREMGKRQSQVSQWIADLEIDFGVELFVRTGNSTRLSEAGEILLPRVIHTVSQADKLAVCASALARDEPMILRLGVDNYIPQSCLNRALSEVLQQQTLNLELYSDDREVLLEQLNNEELDVALLSESSVLHYSDFQYCRLGSYCDVLVVGSTHPLAAETTSTKTTISADQLAQYRELIWTRESISSETEAGYSPSYAAFSEIGTVVNLLTNGVGFAFLPIDMISIELESGKLKRLLPDFEQAEMIRRVELIWQQGLELTEQGKRLIDSMKACHTFTR
ncbi:LysR family transcriptional regulator [Photobacterium alginatilyticum]|uniref:LysR family transcriptional regulator n=1 Tax=Photobacterium alginatilyticum TaxID=1775171 RepID=A0ABW9YJ25_9GAMM|nr:LysR family transcriptional regulator [Photobacterium alginatilyticum]NBI53802.1 LysR family transcriptional regulator [Photobacterium alginatilyticum]